MRKILFLSIIILSVLTLFAKPRKKDTENLPLFYTKWILKEIHGMPVTQGLDTAFIIFSDNYKMSGNLGCNLFFGSFSSGKKRIKLDFVGSTRRLCIDMSLEEQFSRAIRDDITHYHIEKNKLYLRYKENVVLKFEGITLPQ
ncbi:MAG: META domain-containing protein [Bacteroidetes bacterium]|nr:META domain-containing protein [Bacteroidota bacterium]MCL2301950.1 META domain-containing protein [Lentimicrobiaceae bacterium]